MGIKNISLKSIASECGVSIMTVSRALRDSDGVSSDVKRKIRETALALGYMPNHVAQMMKKDEHPVVAILIDDYMNLYYNVFLDELMRQVGVEKEFDFVLLHFKDFDIEVVKQCILQRVDLVVSHVTPDEDAFKMMGVNNIKVVIVGSGNDVEGINTVSVNDQMGCVLAARYLRNFHDCNKYIYAGVDYFLSKKRQEWFYNELVKLHGAEFELKVFDIDREPVQTIYDYIVDGYRNVFFYNDAYAYKVVSELDEIVFDIRRTFSDFHLVGFDGLCEHVPGLKQITTIKIDYPKFVKSVLDTIKSVMKGEVSSVQHIILPVMLHRRKV